MKITVNGHTKDFSNEQTVAQLLDALGLDAARVAVELNRSIVMKEAFETALLSDGDVIEVVQFVGGG